MRPIDADAIPYTMLYKEDWMRAVGEEAQGAWKSDIDNMPTIEPKRGRWIVAEDIGDCCYRCSNCGFIRDAYLLDVGKYCPNCGARMEEKK